MNRGIYREKHKDYIHCEQGWLYNDQLPGLGCVSLDAGQGSKPTSKHALCYKGKEQNIGYGMGNRVTHSNKTYHEANT